MKSIFSEFFGADFLKIHKDWMMSSWQPPAPLYITQSKKKEKRERKGLARDRIKKFSSPVESGPSFRLLEGRVGWYLRMLLDILEGL